MDTDGDGILDDTEDNGFNGGDEDGIADRVINGPLGPAVAVGSLADAGRPGYLPIVAGAVILSAAFVLKRRV